MWGNDPKQDGMFSYNMNSYEIDHEAQFFNKLLL